MGLYTLRFKEDDTERQIEKIARLQNKKPRTYVREIVEERVKRDTRKFKDALEKAEAELEEEEEG